MIMAAPHRYWRVLYTCVWWECLCECIVAVNYNLSVASEQLNDAGQMLVQRL